MENKANLSHSSNKINIDPIPSVLRIYGFLLMILIFFVVLFLAKMINIPMGYTGFVSNNQSNIWVVKLGDLSKLEFLPESGDRIKLSYLESRENIGDFTITSISVQDSTIMINPIGFVPKNISNLEVKLLSKNTTLFDLVFERFY